MNLEMEKKCEFQHHLNVLKKKSLDLDYKKWIFICPFWVSVVCIYWLVVKNYNPWQLKRVLVIKLLVIEKF
jgi:hypothetical protein